MRFEAPKQDPAFAALMRYRKLMGDLKDCAEAYCKAFDAGDSVGIEHASEIMQDILDAFGKLVATPLP